MRVWVSAPPKPHTATFAKIDVSFGCGVGTPICLLVVA